MISVLFVVMEFAPVNTTGNFRSLKFVKYLGEYGITPVVVTLTEEVAVKIFDAKVNNDLLNDIPEGTPVYRIPCDEIKRSVSKVGKFLDIYFSLTDNIASAWEKKLFEKLPLIIELHKPKLIYTSVPPFSSGILAKKISQKFNLPLCVDMRDLWSFWGSNPNGSYLHFALKYWKEKKVFEAASKIIGVTPQLLDIFRKAHPSINQQKFEYIPNGYDSHLAIGENSNNLAGKKFVIGYVGSFYYVPEANENAIKPWWKRSGHHKLQYFPVKENWLYRSPYFFFKALKWLFDKDPHLRKKVRFDFIGNEPMWLVKMVNDFGLNDIYHYHGFLSHAKTLEVQETFNAFLATSEKVEGGEHYCLPSKIFDYIQNRKPILGFVTNGIQKDFLLHSGLSLICDPDNTEDSATKILQLINRKIKVEINIEYLKQYHRKVLTEKLANVFKSVVS